MGVSEEKFQDGVGAARSYLVYAREHAARDLERTAIDGALAFLRVVVAAPDEQEN